MTADLKSYSAYKDSRVPWLGEVPEHWAILPNRAFFEEVKERDHPEEPLLSVTITKGVIQQRALLADSSKKDSSNQDKSAYKLVRPGDIAYNKMRAWQGAIGVSDYQGIVSPAYVVERPREGASSRYLHYLLRTPAFAKEAERWSYGITSDMWSLRPEHFKMIYGCLPPLPEQAAIVRYLDHVDRRIQRYIRAKQKLIALLEEQKQAVIHQAVTGRIDVRTGRPYPVYKNSGVEWLGKVPEHWVVAALRYRYQQCLGKMLDTKHITGEYLVPYLRNVDVQWEDINVLNLPMIDIRPFEVDRYTVRPGDLLVCEGGEVGRCAIWEEETGVYGYQKALHRLRPHLRNRDRPRFMYYTLRLAVAKDAFNDGHESTIGHLTGDKLRTHRFPFPPCPEQLCIEKFLDNQTESIDSAMATERRVIDLLREYRTRLIADVVTGKLDVREATSRLPDEIEESQPLDEAEARSEPVDGGIERSEALH